MSLLIFLLWSVCLAHVESLTISDFYPFGEDRGDTTMVKNDDGGSPNIPISTKFPYFNHQHDKLIVSTNGAISFLTPVSQYTPDPFPLDGDRRLITPFWADVDTRKGGNVRYRETTNLEILERASNEIKSNLPAFYRFRAAWVFIATWDNVAFFGCSSTGCLKRNTFQAVLMTNGQHSFTIFNYANIEWTTGTASSGNADTGLGGKPAQVGFNAGDGKVYYVVNGSRTKDIVNINKKSNVRIPGKFLFRIDSSEIGGGGCNTKGNVIITPRSGPMLGGQHLTFSGPCLEEYTSFKIKFSNTRYTLICEMDSPYSFYCITPRFNSTGDIQVDIILASENKTDMFIGNYTVLNPAFSKVLVNRHNGSSWENGEHIISWNGNVKELQNSSTVDIYVYSIKEENGEIKLNPFIAKTNILNSIGWTTFSLKMTEQVAILRVTSRVQTAYIMPQRGIWSDMFPVTPSRTYASLFCKDWIKKEGSSPKLSVAEPCPCTLQQALLDIVKYQPDPDCNMLHVESEGRGNCRYRRDAQHCVRLTIPSEDGTDNVCCFNEHGILIDSRSHEGGTQQRYHYRGDDHGNIPYVTNFCKDVVPFLHCCRFSQTSANEISNEKETYSLCQDFLALRRYSSCENYDPPRPARTSGDPHITTLDGLSYTFNGAGEFVYIYTEDDLFKSQIRFEQFRKDDGSLVKATVATALAMEYANSSDCIEIRLNSIRTADVLRNGELLDFQDSRWINVKGVTIILLPTKGNNTDKSFMIVFQEIKIAFSIEASKDILNVMPVVQGKDLNGTLKGLLGNYDGSPSNDLLFSTHQQLLQNETDDSLIFKFGMSWAINESESLFTYEPGKSFVDYRQPSFLPVFESSVSVTEEVMAVCGEDKDCIFDFSVTGSRDVAEQSRAFQKQFQESQQAAVIVLTCDDLPTIPGGVWETTNGNLENSSAFFVCRDGYTISDSISNVTCLNGRWKRYENVSCQLNSLQTTSPGLQPGTDILMSQNANLPAYIGVGVGIFLLTTFIIVFILYQRNKARRGQWKIFSNENPVAFTKSDDTVQNSAVVTQLPMEQNKEKY
ncbi:LOW QUALITY PROTEIN: sushi domain-containing protein 2-like [Saccostrea cucullata]|uniref:LOW QUALITY PROTEIN: sushi domain-containing protein 2-like n=1 Tax=Saccostrea cuccullata TaxID=36930 RepID=UPI002ED32141